VDGVGRHRLYTSVFQHYLLQPGHNQVQAYLTQRHNQLQAYKPPYKQSQVQRTSNHKLTQRQTDHNQTKNAINQHSILEEVNICLTFGGGDHVFLCSFPLSSNPEQQRALSSCSPVFPFPRIPKIMMITFYSFAVPVPRVVSSLNPKYPPWVVCTQESIACD
jgi:hypothetical protein